MKIDKNTICDMYLSGKSAYVIADELNVSTGKVYYYLEKSNVKRRSNKINSKKYLINENYFNKIDSSEKAYFLGFIYADGYITKDGCFGIAVHIQDIDILKKISKAMSSTYPIKEYYSDTTHYCRLLIRNSKIVSSLVKHGVVLNKTNILESPKIKQKLIQHFIRGYFDGDGCITFSKSSQSTISFVGTDNILSFIHFNLLENNVISKNLKLEKRKNEHIVSYIRYCGNSQCRKILNYLYKDSFVFLDRKFHIYSSLVQ